MFVCALLGSCRATAGSKGGHGAAGKEQNSTLHPLHATLHWEFPQRHQCESQAEDFFLLFISNMHVNLI